MRLIEKPGSLSCLIYTQTGSKNNPGGLKHRKVSPKQVTHHANTERPDYCFIRIYKEYCSHRPEEVTGVIPCQINKQTAFAFQISTKHGRLVPSMKLLHHTYFGCVKVYGFGVIVHSILQHYGHPAPRFWL